MAGRIQRWRNLLLDNMGLKVTALLASVALFSIVHGAEDAQRSLFVDVIAILPPPESGKMLVSDLPDQIKVTLRGTRSQINAIRRDHLHGIQVRLTDTNRRYLYFDPTSIEVPAGINVVQLAPSTVPLVWVDAVERNLPITPRVMGRTPEGFAVRLADEPTEPGYVSVHGPDVEVEPLNTVYTEPIDVTGLKPGSHERQVPLERPHQHITYRHDGAVKVRLEIVPELTERAFKRLEVEAVGDAVVQLRPERVNIKLRGPSASVERLDPEHVVPFVALTDLNQQAGAEPLRVQVRGIPAGVEVVAIEPPDVLVRSRRARN